MLLPSLVTSPSSDAADGEAGYDDENDEGAGAVSPEQHNNRSASSPPDNHSLLSRTSRVTVPPESVEQGLQYQIASMATASRGSGSRGGL